MFTNARIQVRRTTGSRGPGGFTFTGQQVVLEADCDRQPGTEILERLQSLHGIHADEVIFVEGVSSVNAGDHVELVTTEGQTIEGIVQRVDELSEMLIISYDA